MSISYSELKSYLEWRFRVNNHAKYQKYRDEWVNNVLNGKGGYNIDYFILERDHLIERGILK